MPEFSFFDTNVTIGRPNIPKFRTAPDAAAARSELARLGIAGALVRHTLSAEYHPKAGNEALVAALDGAAGWEPNWAVMPHWTGEFPNPQQLRRQMAENRVRAVILYPQREGFPLRESVTGPLFEMLAEARVPVFLPAVEATLAQVEETASKYPALPVVVSDTSYQLARELYPVLTKCGNVMLEISGFMLHTGIEDICKRFGEERLLFGTRYPLYNPGCAVAAVMFAQIPEDAKRKIASGNIERLLGEVRL